MSKYERRSFPLEIRADVDEDDSGSLVGYAAVFDQPTTLWEGFTEVVRKGAFTTTIVEDDIRALFNHKDDFVLGRTKPGTLELEEDDHGLRVVIDLPPAQWAQDLRASISRGDIDAMSFGFIVRKDTMERDDDGTTLRELLDVILFDVSPVTWPAYPTTEISARGQRFVDEEELRARAKALLKSQEPVPADSSEKDRRRAVREMQRRYRQMII